ncbi:response regulator [Desulfogranum mediterraneum]|uniref:response regulator n=1 Tax=Desulfogranum mediterraneum TaxID=160661 RepID=UPI0004229642|nr:response regulator [Desulfogranum mediterraneum]
MSSIALSYSIFTQEKEIREQLAQASGYELVSDRDIIDQVNFEHGVERSKVERALYGPPSVFNQFTLERETITAYLKAVVAAKAAVTGMIFSGFISQLIPASVSHVLKVGIFDDKSHRLRRAVAEGLTEKAALKLMKRHDAGIGDWVDFLHKKPANDPSLYDIFLSRRVETPEEAVQLILENYRKPTVLISPASRQAAADMVLSARVELVLAARGYSMEVACSEGRVLLRVNKSVHNFTKLSRNLTSLVAELEGVEKVEVRAGREYHVSIYRDQEFKLPPKVLLVDDEQEFVQTLSERLNTRSYGSHPVFDGEQALECLVHDTPDVMVLDLKMPGMQGVEVLERVKASKPQVQVIILTGHGSEEERKTCMDFGAFAYLRKPVDLGQLTTIIDQAYTKTATTRAALA